ncbi:MAG: 2-oxo acid dehydrogenase subunit E2 [Actinobacteria bacterium]|nr:2-oxo acid dehydrogenase subunit E2 [Actinomycetota bacterium]
MPRLSDQMEEATIVTWCVASGAAVGRGDALFEAETDKATMAYEAEAEGVVELLVEEGATVALGAPVARLHPFGTELEPAAAPAVPGEAPEPRPGEAPERRPEEATVPPRRGADPARADASPVARRIAAEIGVDLATLAGSGPRGRIVKKDVLAAAAAGAPRPASPPSPASPAADGDPEIVVEALSRAQELVARRMSETKSTVPEFTTSIDLPMDAVLALRASLKQAARDGAVPSINDFVLKAAALALREVPRANGRYREGRFELYREVNVGLAVATDDGLTVPVIRGADEKPLGRIAAEARTLAGRVRDRTITPPELARGTFTVSNLGMFGISSFTAIINRGQAAILAVGGVERRLIPDPETAAPLAASFATATLTADHRILYGADAARFLAALRERLAAPAALLL